MSESVRRGGFLLCDKGQAAIELAFIISIMVLFLIAFVSVLGDRVVDASESRNKESAEGIADFIEAELSSASSTQDGFYRVLMLPETLDGLSYRVDFSNSTSIGANFTDVAVTVDVGSNNYTAYRVLPSNIVGSDIRLGWTSMEKRDGVVHLSPLSGVDGSCGLSNDVCESGVHYDLPDSSTHLNWECGGENGGATEECALLIIQGVCSSLNESCVSGTFSDVSDNATHLRWGCLGSNTGGSSECSLRIVNGVCGLTVNTCSSGTFSDVSDNATHLRWGCLGSNTGGSSECSLRIVNGVCGLTVNTCRRGTFSNVSDNLTDLRWGCLGSNTGINTNCSSPKPRTITNGTVTLYTVRFSGLNVYRPYRWMDGDRNKCSYVDRDGDVSHYCYYTYNNVHYSRSYAPPACPSGTTELYKGTYRDGACIDSFFSVTRGSQVRGTIFPSHYVVSNFNVSACRVCVHT